MSCLGLSKHLAYRESNPILSYSASSRLRTSPALSDLSMIYKLIVVFYFGFNY